jgi:hypothetical protein
MWGTVMNSLVPVLVVGLLIASSHYKSKPELRRCVGKQESFLRTYLKECDDKSGKESRQCVEGILWYFNQGMLQCYADYAEWKGIP